MGCVSNIILLAEHHLLFCEFIRILGKYLTKITTKCDKRKQWVFKKLQSDAWCISIFSHSLVWDIFKHVETFEEEYGTSSRFLEYPQVLLDMKKSLYWLRYYAKCQKDVFLAQQQKSAAHIFQENFLFRPYKGKSCRGMYSYNQNCKRVLKRCTSNLFQCNYLGFCEKHSFSEQEDFAYSMLGGKMDPMYEMDLTPYFQITNPGQYDDIMIPKFQANFDNLEIFYRFPIPVPI